MFAWLPGLVLSVVLLVCPAVAESAGPTNVAGTISANATWTLANSPYVLTGDVTVAAGVSLTVEPGVVVQGNSSTRLLTVNGSLSAVGSSSQRITFTSTTNSAPGEWGGIKFGTSAGSSTMQFVDVRYGGSSNVSAAYGMIEIWDGALLLEDSTVSESSVSGVKIWQSGGSATSLTARRTKFEANGFAGSAKHGHGVYAGDARVVVEDSAFWSNANDGFYNDIAGSYALAPSELTGTSFWGNGGRGIYLATGVGSQALAADGHVAGKPGNAVYDNGTFGFSASETWVQMGVTRPSLSVDWTGTYWGPVTHVACGLGNQHGYLSFGAPKPDPSYFWSIPRSPVTATIDAQGNDWCVNNTIAANAPASALPDLYFDAPPPTFGGLLAGSLRGCTDCQREDGQFALAHDSEGGNGIAYSPEPVNTASGSLTELATDLQLAGPGTPFAWTRSYNSADTSAGALGQGWSHAFDTTLTVVNASTGELEYHAGSGQLTRFTKITGGSTGAATYGGKGFDGQLKRLSDNTYQITTRDQRVFTFDTAGKLSSIKPRFLPATTLAYTSGKLSSISDSAGRTISITYSAADPALIEKVALPDARYVQYGYTGGRLTSVRDPRGKTWTLAYDGSGRLTSIEDPVGHFELQNIQYDAQGRVTSEQNGAGDATTYAYTSSAPYELTTMTLPGRGSWVYKHLNNLLISVIDPLNRTTSYSYDGMGRKASETDGRGNTTRFEYDTYGNVVKEIAPQPLGYTTSRVFNATNDLLTETDGRGNTTTYAYATASDAAADYQVGQLKTVTDREAAVTTLKYWTSSSSPAPPATNVGLLKSVSNQRGKTTGYEYDTAGRLTTVENAKAGTILSKFAWTLDAAGNPTKAQTTRGSTDTYDAHEYDARNRLTASCYAIAASANDCAGATNAISYAYDKVSNRTQEVRTGSVGNTGTIDYTYNNADQLTSSVQSGTTTSYTYDANGNQATAGTRSFTYDLADQQLTSTSGGATTTYGYDGDGQRTSSATSGGSDLGYTWDPLADSGIPELALERTSTGGLVRRYAGGPLGATAFTDSSGSYSYHHDPLGAVTDLTDASGAAQWRYEYDAYGAERTATNVSGTAPANRLRFNGQYLDPETSTYHLRARQYDPTVGRFGALDPIQSPLFDAYAAAYVYVNGQPTVLVDPYGLWGVPQGLKDFGAGVADGASFGVSTALGRRVGVNVNTNSPYFKVGQVTGTVALGAATGGAGTAAITTRLAVRSSVKVAAGIATGAAGSVTGGAIRAGLEGRAYTPEDAAIDAVLGGLGGGVSGSAFARICRDADQAAKAGDDGIVYLRTDKLGSKPYVGQSKSAARYDARQVEHARENPFADFEFSILGRAKPGTELDRLEEFFIRTMGGPTARRNPSGALANRRHQMSDRRYQKAGGAP